MNRIRLSAATLLITTILGAACAPAAVPQAETNGVVLKVTDACSDGSKTFLSLQIEVDANRWHLDTSSFAGPYPVFFEASINFTEDGLPFSSTSSGTRSDPIYDPLSQVATANQLFIFPGSPSPGSRLALQATVTIFNAPGQVTVPGQFEIEFPSSQCQ